MKRAAVPSILCAVMLLAVAIIAEPQQGAKIPRIGFLNAGSDTTSLKGFLQEFRNLGYVEGKNVAIESRFANGKLDRLPALANELVGLKVDVLVTGGFNDALAAKNATKTIPVVFLGVVTDPVGSGLVNSLSRPGGNVTGFTTIRGGVGRQTSGATQRNHSEPYTRCRSVGFTGSRD
jgi:putative ABC transport system substrate-binding protein